ncbi:amino acid adenylation domain-containing protein [Plantactinospora sp. B24E8]|uniref:amino acid adenylation domain-containing protein n=1 Tax=Plantactinospora sp. B24E8 TaxID=3153567 RepID=UPI00325F6838
MQTGATLPRLFAHQARLTPDAVAVVDGPRHLTYADVDVGADRVARLLRAEGVRPGALVGVSLARSAELVTTLLGIWRAGAAYVPLDPGHPPERAAWVLADTGAALLVTDGAGVDGVRIVRPVPVGTGPAVADAAGNAPAVQPGPHGDDVAYAIYTSGSTGRPKGVLISHAGIANRVGWTVRRHGLGAADRVLHKTAMSFDAAGWEIFAPLVSGGTVVLAPPGAERDPALLARAAADGEVTVLQVVPSVLRLLVQEPALADCRTLRLLFSAGEPLHAELCQRLLERVKPEVWNTYGPTECAIDVTAYQFDPAQATGPVPIGRPIDNLRVLVLDDAGEPVPIGVVGELYAGGVGLGHGYLGRPDLTAERFVPDPYGPPGSRLYRTGDLVRWRADGAVEYVGRRDHQIKVNGVRVEPGEVEAALVSHPAVRGAAVTAVPDTSGGHRLVGYLLGEVPDGLRGFLRERLPEAMIPGILVPMAEFPLTTSGKVDRAALPPVIGDTDVRPPYLAPRDDAERAVAAAWSALLDVDRIGAHDDFFQLGGTSLLLTRLLARLRAGTGVELPLAELFTASTVERQALLLTRSGPAGPPVVPVSRDGALPLSFGQHRQWFLDRLQPGSPEWVTPLFVRLPATVDPDLVRRALDVLGGRHEALRTRYPDEGGEPRQVLVDPAPIELTVVDATGGDLAGWFGRQFGRGFDLAEGPLWRALLARVSDTDQALLVTIHHIACDGWSAVILERELREVVDALRAGRAPALPDLPVQYPDFAAWQRARLTGPVLADELAYWRTELAGIAPLELPTDRPRPPRRDPAGAFVSFTVPAPLARALTELGRAHGATRFVTLLTAFAALLRRYTGQHDIAVGSPVAGRTRPEVADVVGFFLNNLVLRCRLAGEPSYLEALARVRHTARSAFAHQEAPFERLVDELQPERDLSRTPLYQVAFDLHDDDLTTARTADGDLDAFLTSWRIAKTDLALYLKRHPDDSLTGAFEYSRALFDHATVERIADHFVRLLDRVTAAPDTPLTELDLLTAAERAVLLAPPVWPAAAPERCLHEVFAARAARTPDAVAVVADGESLTYAELNARANRLAHHLRSLGVGPESLVGVCLERGPDLVPTLLGVLKAGAGYLPLDPAQPADRTGYLVRDAGARVVVSRGDQLDRLAGAAPETLVLLDRDADLLAGCPEHDPQTGVTPDNLVYVIYTSGSTGRPKGVCLSHANVLRLFTVTEPAFDFDDRDVWTLFHSYAFDFSVWELWGALLYGGRLVVVPREVTRDPDAFVDLLVAQRVTVLNQTPSAFRALVGLARDGDPRLDRLAVRTVVFGGERLEVGDLLPWARRFGLDRPELVNMYGITETTVHVTYHRITPVDLETPLVSPVGVPLPDLRVVLLDESGRPVPVGVPGEIHVGGAGVARGYLHRPELTAQRFVPDPYPAEVPDPVGTGRLYRSGDLARRRPDGTLDFVGRADHQVKIRGYRVELGEIEAALVAHPAVREAVVVLTDDTRLVGYFVPDGELPTLTGLRERLAGVLPDYMVPAAFVAVERIPLTVNGKLDRRALPDPDGAAVAADADHVPPRNPVEERIAAGWTELLRVTGVGVHDNFFARGGDSILAVRLASWLQEEFDVELTVRTVFERPTVAQLGTAVEELIRAQIAELSDAEVSAAQHPSRQEGKQA